MKKDAYYFSHDANASSDPKCAALINDFGMKGYGFYWMMIEILHQQKGGKLEKFPKLMEGLAHQFRVEKDFVVKQIEALLHDYFLLQEDDKFIWSDRVLRNLDEKNDKREARVEAGRIGGIKSGLSRQSKQNEAPLKAIEAPLTKSKQSKVKERKEKESINGNTDFSGEKKEYNAGEFIPPKKGMVY